MLLYSYANAGTIEGKVVSVLDGNTFELETSDKEMFLIMLYGVDCPENGQSHADEATNELKSLIYKKKVTVKIKGKDRKGVRLGEVRLRNGDIINKIIIDNGFGWAELQYAKGAYTALEAEAKSLGKGLWQADNPTPPWIFRRQQSMKEAKGR